MASILDGKALADVIRGELKERVSAALASGRRAPCLGVVLVGSRPDSATYVRSKKAACAALGMTDRGIELPAEATQAQVLEAVAGLNADAGVDGILVQLPLPAHIDERAVLGAISLAKDADGLHPLNVGALALKGHTPLAVACTPRGCVELLRRSGVAMEGKRAVVLGRSNIVGIPMALLLLEQNATVTVCHSRTADLPAVIREVRAGGGERAGRGRAGLAGALFPSPRARPSPPTTHQPHTHARAHLQADILIAAIGKPNFVKGEWLKPSAVVIDVGINSVDDASAPRGYRLVGDCDFASCQPACAAISPVPGGVGPLTIAMLLSNTMDLYDRSHAQAQQAGGGSA